MISTNGTYSWDVILTLSMQVHWDTFVFTNERILGLRTYVLSYRLGTYNVVEETNNCELRMVFFKFCRMTKFKEDKSFPFPHIFEASETLIIFI